MYYPCSENKGADQLRGYREADLRLCFRIGKNPVFSRCGSNIIVLHCYQKSTLTLFCASASFENKDMRSLSSIAPIECPSMT